MGFYLRCALARAEDATERARIEAAMTAAYPSFVMVRPFSSPFSGVIAGHDPDDAEEDDAWIIEDRLRELSVVLGDRPLAYVMVDCFGGTCRYDGHVVRNGVVVHSEPSSSRAHVRLFVHLGVVDPPWHFPPFTRGFMTTGVAGTALRLPVTFHVQARWLEAFRLAVLRARVLPPPWRITIETVRDCVLVHDEQLVASINTVDDQVELRAHSYVDLARTRALALELVPEGVELAIKAVE
jgi:hypothetical protein